MKNNKVMIWIVVIALIAVVWYLISIQPKQTEQQFIDNCEISDGNVLHIPSIPPEPQLGCYCDVEKKSYYYGEKPLFDGCGIRY